MTTKVLNQASGRNWQLYHGDAVEVIRGVPDNSIDYCLHSPPFANLYIYSDSVADMGNAKDDAEFFEHYRYLIHELYRVTVPGRLVSVHCKDLPLYASRDGVAGLSDFPGHIVAAFERGGWTFQSRVTIWKDPVIEMQRTKNHGLLYKNFQVRAEVCRQGMADYLLTFRKWDGLEGTESVKPVIHRNQEYPLEVWQRWASPVWMDIDQTNVLNYQVAREDQDEKHICPLQLDVIERGIALWSNPGDVVLSPFAGIGSEGVVALRMGRKFVGVELKESYFDWAARYLREAEQATAQLGLFEQALQPNGNGARDT
jgi:DNA modification methylase